MYEHDVLVKADGLIQTRSYFRPKNGKLKPAVPVDLGLILAVGAVPTPATSAYLSTAIRTFHACSTKLMY